MSLVNVFADLVNEAIAREADQPRQTWWLSFADPARPPGEQFLGVVIVDDCPGLVTARVRMAEAGVVSPGGEIRAAGFDPAQGPGDQAAALARLPRLRLLSLADLRAAGMEVKRP
jgi:hypothetical protein